MSPGAEGLGKGFLGTQAAAEGSVSFNTEGVGRFSPAASSGEVRGEGMVYCGAALGGSSSDACAMGTGCGLEISLAGG